MSEDKVSEAAFVMGYNLGGDGLVEEELARYIEWRARVAAWDGEFRKFGHMKEVVEAMRALFVSDVFGEGPLVTEEIVGEEGLVLERSKCDWPATTKVYMLALSLRKMVRAWMQSGGAAGNAIVGLQAEGVLLGWPECEEQADDWEGRDEIRVIVNKDDEGRWKIRCEFGLEARLPDDDGRETLGDSGVDATVFRVMVDLMCSEEGLSEIEKKYGEVQQSIEAQFDEVWGEGGSGWQERYRRSCGMGLP